MQQVKDLLRRIVADSSCDFTDAQLEQYQVCTVPFSMQLGADTYHDDHRLSIAAFLAAMKANTGKVGSAAPSPLLFKQAFEQTRARFAVTLSGNLSACYDNAVLGREMADLPEAEKPHIFDSKSASAGEVLLALKISRYIDEGLHSLEIVSRIEAFIKEMKTYFVLENIDNLLKNGRLNKVAGKLTQLLNIKPILGSDGDGNIKLFGYGRGRKSIIKKMVDTVAESGRATEQASLVVTHCCNQELAEELVEAVSARHRFMEVLILPTRGLSSVYADHQGVIMAY